MLIDDITESFYVNICRGLFEKDKLLYSLMISTKIQIYDKIINDIEWNFYLRGAITSPEATEACPHFLTEKVYADVRSLAILTPVFKTLVK